MKKLIFIMSVIILTSCMTQKKVMNSWLGSYKPNLITTWGPPTRTEPDGTGGEILVYAAQTHIPRQTFYDGYGGSNTRPSQTFWDYKMFWVDKYGKVYHWMTDRQEIPPMQINLYVYHRK